MILAWLLLVILAAVLVRQNRRREVARPSGHRKALWFLLWTSAGFLTSFSVLTAFSIGVLILPFAAISLLWAARAAPYYAEASGFLVGIGMTALVIASLNH